MDEHLSYKKLEELSRSLYGDSYNGNFVFGTAATDHEAEPAPKKKPAIAPDYPPEKDRPGKREPAPMPGSKPAPRTKRKPAPKKKNAPVIKEHKGRRFWPSFPTVLRAGAVLFAMVFFIGMTLYTLHVFDGKRDAERDRSAALARQELLVNKRAELDDARRKVLEDNAVDGYVDEHNMISASGSEKISSGPAVEGDGLIGNTTPDYGAAETERSLLAKVLSIFGINI